MIEEVGNQISRHVPYAEGRLSLSFLSLNTYLGTPHTTSTYTSSYCMQDDRHMQCILYHYAVSYRRALRPVFFFFSFSFFGLDRDLTGNLDQMGFLPLHLRDQKD